MLKVERCGIDGLTAALCDGTANATAERSPFKSITDQEPSATDAQLDSLDVGCSKLNVGRSSGGFAAADTLRALLAQRFPTAMRAPDDALVTGIPTIDSAGGLPRPGLTEVVCSAPSCGSQLLLGQLLHVTRAQSLRVALVDRGDSFDPASWPAPVLEHLVWVRARSSPEAVSAADLLARDANLALVILDLRHTAFAELRRIAAREWYRLQRAVEPALTAALVLTPFSLVPSARLRLELGDSHSLSAHQQPRPELTIALAPEFLRQRVTAAG